MAILAFNFGFMFTLIGFYMIAKKPTFGTGLMYAVIVGAVAAGIGFFVGRKR